MPKKFSALFYSFAALTFLNLLGSVVNLACLIYVMTFFEPGKLTKIDGDMSNIVRLIQIDLTATALRNEMNDSKIATQRYLPPIEIHVISSAFSQDRGGTNSDGSVIRIFIPYDLLQRLDERKMRAYLAHELGHIAFGHKKQTNIFYLDAKENRKYVMGQEMEADSFAATFVDKRILAQVIRDLAKDDQEEMAVRLENIDE